MTGLEYVVAVLDGRFDLDARGRIVGIASRGRTPRFVLGRAREGVVWRFRHDVSARIVREVARLAGREAGIPIEAGGVARPPDRLFPIGRVFDEGVDARPALEWQHEWVEGPQGVVGELWSLPGD